MLWSREQIMAYVSLWNINIDATGLFGKSYVDTLEESKKVCAMWLFTRTPSINQRIMRNLEIVDRFLQKPL